MTEQTTALPPLASLRDWHVGATDNELFEVRIVLADPAEAKALAQWMFLRQELTYLQAQLTSVVKPHGCVCPVGAEATCQGGACPRKRNPNP